VLKMLPLFNYRALRAHIEQNGVEVQRRLAGVESLARYVAIFKFHLYSARDAMKGVIYEDDPYGMKNLRLVFGDDERQDQLNRARIASEAHTLAAVRSARAMWDVFAFLVNDVALGSRLEERECNIFSVRDALPKSKLKSSLGDLTSSEWFRYVNAFVNTAKHRNLVPQSFRVSFEDDKVGIRIEAFEYNGKPFPSYWIRELLHGVLDVKNRLVDCGRSLDEHVTGATA
jgi:hypothetical protein